MTAPSNISFTSTNHDDLADLAGHLVVFVSGDGKFDASARKVNSLGRKAVQRLVDGAEWSKMEPGDVATLAWPTGLAAEAVHVVKLDRKPDVQTARKAGSQLAKRRSAADMCVLAGAQAQAAEVAFGLVMRSYAYTAQKSKQPDPQGALQMMVADPDAIKEQWARMAAVADGVFFTRDLVNAPGNVLTTTSFADQLAAMTDIGLKVEVLEEAEMEKLGMGALLCVGQGSVSPSKLVVMRWDGGGDEAPFALVGKGVVFDTGGISLKPGAGMEDMTMDMGGGGVVSGVMKTLALRKAKANVVGLVGIVENMPSGNAVRPGDVVKSMKGDTIEVINTDAEGRLVLSDVLWYAQDRFKPCAMINLATLTGAMLVALGHEKAGVFSNSDDLSAAFIKAAESEGEGAWRMPMGPAYDALIKSDIADMKNVGGRFAGSITAAQFLGRFVKDEVPWCHLDIAGTASLKTEGPLSPKGASGWGVMALNRLIADKYEN